MELKTTLKQHIEVDHGDLDSFLTERFGFDSKYEFTIAESMSYDSKKNIRVDPELLDEQDREYIKEVLETKKWKRCQTEALLCYLCENREIPAGNYLISVWW